MKRKKVVRKEKQKEIERKRRCEKVKGWKEKERGKSGFIPGWVRASWALLLLWA